jgi:hypothetical protein
VPTLSVVANTIYSYDNNIDLIEIELYIINRFQFLIQEGNLPKIWSEQCNKIIAKLSSKASIITYNSQNITKIDYYLSTISSLLQNND